NCMGPRSAAFCLRTCGDCYRCVETMSQRPSDGTLRRRNRTVRLLTFKQFAHSEELPFFQRLTWSKIGRIQAPGVSRLHLPPSRSTHLSVALLLRTGNHKTLLYQVQTMEIRTPLD